MVAKLAGKVVADRFEIRRPAGAGGMGIVYYAYDRETDRAVALKVLLERDQGPADRFAHEVEVLSKIDHPNVVGYVTHGVTDEGDPFLVMPWLEGVDLQQRLLGGPLSIPETLTLAHRVAAALECLHGQGLVHGDLKPSNLFLPGGAVDRVQVIDLGVARSSLASRAQTQSGGMIGTPGFIAPEQARSDGAPAPSVDVFALGCVLFECLTGRRLFSGSHLLEDAPRICELRPETPPALDRLVQRMVAKDPDGRPPDGADLLRSLDALARGLTRDARAAARFGLTQSERRVVTVLVLGRPAERLEAVPPLHATEVEPDPFLSSAARFGVRAYPLTEGTAIALAPERTSAADQATVLARFARFAVETFPGAQAALTTGSAVTSGGPPVGEAVDRAVALVRAAGPAEGVRADQVSATLVASRFEVRHAGDARFILEERSLLDPTRPLLGKPTSCVGRERELSMLEAALAACAQGAGPKVVLVTAAAGAGKSRLRHELVRRVQARSSPPRVLQCHGDPLLGGTPYGMVAQLVRQAAGLRHREPDDRARDKVRAHVASLVAEADAARVTDFLGELVGAAFGDEGRLAVRAARAFEHIVHAWCREGPLALILDDLQWSDAPSLKLIERALRKLPGANAFVLALARPEIHERLPALFANCDVIEIRLPPIPKQAGVRLVHEVMGDDAPPEDVERIVEESEGNGFYLEELIRAEAERSMAAAGSARVPPLVADLPETVVAVGQARLERLDPAARRALRAASIYGDVFTLHGVRALFGGDLSALAPILDTLVEHEAVSPSEEPRLDADREYAFRHALLRGTAYATLTEDDRALGHRLAAAWLDKIGEDPEIVAMHWLEGGDRARAAAGFSRASDARATRAQPEAAARCSARALLVGDPAKESVEAVAARVRCLARSLSTSRGLDPWDVASGLAPHVAALEGGATSTAQAIVTAALEPSLQALRSANEALLPAILADAACALGAVADQAGARRLLAEATARASDDTLALRDVLHASAKVAAWNGEMALVAEHLLQTVLPFDPRARLESLLMLAMAVAWVDGRAGLARGLGYVARAEALVRSELPRASGEEAAREDPVAQVQCAKSRLSCFSFAGEHARGAEVAEEAVALARRAGLRFDLAAHLINVGEQYLYLGRRDEARASFQEALEIALDMDNDRAAKLCEIFLAYLDGSADRLVRAADAARAENVAFVEVLALLWLGRLLASSSEDAARDALTRALHLAQEGRMRWAEDDCREVLETLGS
jgi:tetratricopeptide (TPR) repeat protein